VTKPSALERLKAIEAGVSSVSSVGPDRKETDKARVLSVTSAQHLENAQNFGPENDAGRGILQKKVVENDFDTLLGTRQNPPLPTPAENLTLLESQADKTDKTPAGGPAKICAFVPKGTDKTDKTQDGTAQGLQLPEELRSILDAYPGATVEIRPRTPIPPAPAWPPKPTVPNDWQDHAAWCRLLIYAHRLANRRWVLERWAQAAAGEVRDGALHLPADLPRGLALTELKTHARTVGLSIKDLP
jgi:hypothetical protein